MVLSKCFMTTDHTIGVVGRKSLVQRSLGENLCEVEMAKLLTAGKL